MGSADDSAGENAGIGAATFAGPTAVEVAVEVVYSPRAGEVDVVALKVPAGATLADAVRASALAQRHGLDAANLRCGIWGRACEPACVLRERDRVEIYRPLLVDPKEARRLRYKRHRKEPAAQ
jgi:putative ubiquitin-RnfH superfamily antitoxin RatB of RatAB toxin-antitoxin module